MPLSIVVGPGSEHDSKKLTTLIEELTAKPTELYADSAYDTEHIRSTLNQMGIQANIPVTQETVESQNHTTKPHTRSAAERSFAWIKSFRRITIRYERLASTYKALATTASIIIHLRHGIWR
jgi:transposase